MDLQNSESDRPWVALYPDDIGPELAAEFDDCLAMFNACLAERPDHPAIVYFDRTYSYAELDRLSDPLAVRLAELGVAKGDRVALVTQNSPEFVIGLVATWKVGAIPLPMNPMYRPAELCKIFADSTPKAALCDRADAAGIAEGAALAKIELRLIWSDPAAFGLGFDFPRGTPDPAVLEKGEDLSVILKDYAGRTPAKIAISKDDLGLLLYTSGTTGVPKGAMIKHSSLAFNGELLRRCCGIEGDARILAIAPFFHITGLVCHILTAFSARATLILHFRFEANLVLNIIRKDKPTYTIGAITAFNALMGVPGSSPEDFKSFHRIYSGGAPIPPSLQEQFEERLGKRIYPAYGMTETAAPTHVSVFGREIPVDPESGAMTIGVPGPSTDAIVVDEAGAVVPHGQVGELLVRGPQIMAGYWNKPEDSAAALKDGWMHTGDVGFRDEKGWFFLVDRKKDVIIASGFKVWPREVEDVLYTHPSVREAAVVGAKDAYRGETVKAFVSTRPDAEISPAELVAFCRERLAAYKVPREVVVLPELPKTVTGKIQRVALREV